MSKRGRKGKRVWRERGPAVAQEISEQITSEATERMNGWVKRGRVPWWVRAKASSTPG